MYEHCSSNILGWPQLDQVDALCKVSGGRLSNLSSEPDFIPYLHKLPSLRSLRLLTSCEGWAERPREHPGFSLSPLSRLQLQLLHILSDNVDGPDKVQHLDQLSSVVALSLVNTFPVKGLPPALTALALGSESSYTTEPFPTPTFLSTASDSLHNLHTLAMSAPWVHPESWGTLGPFCSLPGVQNLRVLQVSLEYDYSHFTSLSLPHLHHVQLDFRSLDGTNPPICDFSACKHLEQASFAFFVAGWQVEGFDIDLSRVTGVCADVLRLSICPLPSMCRFKGPLTGWNFSKAVFCASSMSASLDSLMARVAWASGGRLSWEFVSKHVTMYRFAPVCLDGH